MVVFVIQNRLLQKCKNLTNLKRMDLLCCFICSDWPDWFKSQQYYKY